MSALHPIKEVLHISVTIIFVTTYYTAALLNESHINNRPKISSGWEPGVTFCEQLSEGTSLCGPATRAIWSVAVALPEMILP